MYVLEISQVVFS